MPIPWGSVPDIRPFRALRYDPASIADAALVVAPPYDVIGPAEHDRLLARHPANVVRLDLPREEAGDEPDDRYRRAARTLAAWRSDGTLHKDPHPSIYLYEQTYRVPGTEVIRTQRGFFGRLCLETFGPRLGRAAPRANAVGAKGGSLQAAPRDRRQHQPGRGPVTTIRAGASRATLDAASRVRPRSTSWTTTGPATGCGRSLPTATASPPWRCSWPPPRAARSRSPTATTAMRPRSAYRDERRMARSCEEDPAFDYLLMLFLEATAEPLTVLPTHRVVRRLGERGVADAARPPRRALRRRAGGDAPRPCARPYRTAGAVGRRRRPVRACGRATAARILTARRDAFEPYLPAGGEALRGLDVTLLGVALDRLLGLDAEAVAAGAVGYTKSAAEAIERGRRRARRRGRGVPARADAGRLDLGRRGRRRRHAPEIDLFLPEGPDRPRHQPARMVTR